MDTYDFEGDPVTYPKVNHVTVLAQEFSTTIQTMENASEQRWPDNHVGKKRWKFHWQNLTPDEANAVLAFHAAQLGKYKKWAIDDSRMAATLQHVRFDDDKMEAKAKACFKGFDITIEVVSC